MRFCSRGVFAVCVGLVLSACGGGGNGVTVKVEPAVLEMYPMTDMQFTAFVRGTLDRNVEWTVETLDGFEVTQAGGVTTAGNYQAPKHLPPEALNLIKVRATSTVDPTKFDEAIVKIVPVPLEPTSGPSAGGTLIHITGKGFNVANVPEVYFGAEPAALVRVETEVLLSAITPAHIMGEVDVRVVIPGEVEQMYPEAFKFSAGNFQFSGGELLRTCGYYANFHEVVDLDQCGEPELVVTCDYEYELSVLPRELGGNFGNKQTFPYPSGYFYAQDMDVVDLNNDTFNDVVVHTYYDALVFMNKGTMGDCTNSGNWLGFEPAVDYYFPTYGYYNREIVDFNNDGNLDYIFAETYANPGKIYIYEGMADGSWNIGAPALTLTSSGYYMRHMDTGDVDGDGSMDIVASVNYLFGLYDESGINVWFGDNTGQNFAERERVDFSSNPLPGDYYYYKQARGITVVDVDNDNSDEIFYPVYDANALAQLEYNGANIVVEAQHNTGYYADYTSTITSYQLNDTDTAPDITYRSYFNDTEGYSLNLVVLWGDPAGTGLQNNYKTYGIPTYGYNLSLRDLEGDKVPEMIVTGSDGFVVVQQGNPEPDPYELAFGPNLLSMGGNPVDINVINIGQPQRAAALVTTAGPGGSVQIVDLSAGANATTSDVSHLAITSTSANGMRYARASDIDEDGFEDVLAIERGDSTTGTPGAIWLAFGGENPSPADHPASERFTTPFRVVPDVAQALGAEVMDAVPIDLDQDGFMDLVFGIASGPVEAPIGQLGVLWGKPLPLLRTNEPVVLPVVAFETTSQPLPFGFVAERLVAADFDKDNNIDIAGVDRSGNRVVILENTGSKERDQIFAAGAPHFYFVGDEPRDLLLTDVDNDGFLDLIALAELVIDFDVWTEIDVLRNRGTMVFGHPQTGEPEIYRVPGDPYRLAYADLDLDGLEDLIVSSINPTALVIQRSAGEGRFLDAEVFVAGEGPQGVGIADFDNDGKIDLVVGDQDQQGVRFLTNLSE